MSGVSFLVKTFTPSSRRRRRSEKKQKQLSNGEVQDQVKEAWKGPPLPLSPPPSHFPFGYKKNCHNNLGEPTFFLSLFQFSKKFLKQFLCFIIVRMVVD